MTAATHVLTARSVSGKVLNPLSGEPVASCAVYGLVDLAARLGAAEKDPDLEVSVRALEDKA